ncbi:MAG TPA: nuclear transport factor 2 family protein [Solirubrobacterales bacterium]|nr:nuclear transport factor 2 family protein [Solirubrobacterales bacterium]
MASEHRALIERLFDAFNRRDSEEIASLCDPEMAFFPITAEEVGREAPYTGPEGLDAYLGDVAAIWEELLVRATQVDSVGDRLVVRGRVYVRSRERGIRDLPAAWLWEVREGRFVRGEVFTDPDQAGEAFARLRLGDPAV